MRLKCKKIASRNKEGQWPSKKVRGRQQGKYHGGATVKMGGVNPCKRYISTRQSSFTYNYNYFF